MATNIIANQPSEREPTAMPTATPVWTTAGPNILLQFSPPKILMHPQDPLKTGKIILYCISEFFEDCTTIIDKLELSSGKLSSLSWIEWRLSNLE